MDGQEFSQDSAAAMVDINSTLYAKLYLPIWGETLTLGAMRPRILGAFRLPGKRL
jgi:hypothetical protein